MRLGSLGALFGSARRFLLSVCRGTAANFGPCSSDTAEQDEVGGIVRTTSPIPDFFFFQFYFESFQLFLSFSLGAFLEEHHLAAFGVVSSRCSYSPPYKSGTLKTFSVAALFGL